MIYLEYYSLIGGLVAAVICRCYFRNRSDDLNPMLKIYRNTFIRGSVRIKKIPVNRLKLRSQYIDFSCLNPV
jgi:hypothetical protein